ncbi:MAG: ABC transporter substrate-binding protein [Candidatus Rokuibacteriota bacterium]
MATSTARLVVLLLLTVSLIAGGFAAVQAQPAGKILLNLASWSYGVEIVRDNIAKFEQRHPGVSVKYSDFSWATYHDAMVARFASRTPTDVLYASDHWLQEWAAAGWIVPVDEQFPQARQYLSEFSPFVREALTYNGRIYGTPYYADTFIFVYNADHLQRAGFKAPPATLEEWTRQAQAIKAKNIAEFPIALGWGQQDPFSIESFTSLVFAQRDGTLFDKGLTPVFRNPGSAAERVVAWAADALQTKKILGPTSLQAMNIDMIKALQAGAATYGVIPSYSLAVLNDPGQTKEAGKFKIALMPGETHATVGFIRFYAISAQVPKRGKDAMTAAWNFLEYFGGKVDGEYRVTKRWSLEKGLGFAPTALFADRDIRAAFGKWADVDMLQKQADLARVKEGMTSYYGTWDVFSRAELHKAYLGQQKPAETLANMAKKWEELKAKAKR